MKTKTGKEEEGKTLKIVSCIACCCRPRCRLHKENCVVFAELFTRNLASNKKSGQEIKRDVGDLESARDKKLGFDATRNAQMRALLPNYIDNINNRPFPRRFWGCFFHIYLQTIQNHGICVSWVSLQRRILLRKRIFCFSFVPYNIYFCCDCSGRIISW